MVTKTNMSSMPMFSTKQKREYDSNEEDRVYTCKTCNKEFSSFQALGGHRAAHSNRVKNDADVTKKSHTCLYCFEKFVSGQALGGHMRKHRDVMEEKAKPFSSKRIKSLDSFQEDERLQFSDSDLDLVLRIEPIRSMSPGSPSSVILDMESGNENKSMQLVDSNLDRESDPVCKDVSVGEEWRSSYGLKVEYIDFFSKKYDQVEEVPVEIVPVLEDDDSLLELRMGYQITTKIGSELVY